MNLTPEQRAVVHHGDGPCRVTGGFGTGVSTALAARARRLASDGHSVRMLDSRAPASAAWELLGRHGRAIVVLPPADQRALVARMVAAEGRDQWPTLAGELGDPAFAEELAGALLAYQTSFLGEEELLTHAEAAGEPDGWEELAAFAARYLAALEAHGQADEAGVVVQASMLLRDPDVSRAEQRGAAHLLVDDYQLATFAWARLVTQLSGPGGNVVVGGNAGAAVSDDPVASARYLDDFGRRFSAEEIVMETPFRVPEPPTLHLGPEAPPEWDGPARVVRRADVAAVVGNEWPLVVVAGATEGVWPAPRKRHRWFDLRLLGGPDVPDDEVRDREWAEAERRRFAVACSRATTSLLVLAPPPVSPFVADLVR